MIHSLPIIVICKTNYFIISKLQFSHLQTGDIYLLICYMNKLYFGKINHVDMYEMKLKINAGILCQYALEVTSFSQLSKPVLSNVVATSHVSIEI